ncbi:hypothetical protein ACE38W_16025 [Chitinophaga sp. Hz27]
MKTSNSNTGEEWKFEGDHFYIFRHTNNIIQIITNLITALQDNSLWTA